MRFLNFPVKPTFTCLLLMVVVSGCRLKKRVLKSPPHYNFSEVFSDKLDLKLKEISGLTWDTKSKVFLAINDEAGKLYSLDKELHLLPGEVVFGERGDYEDLAILNGTTYILKSDGAVTKLVKDSAGKFTGVPAGKVSVTGTNDFETMFADPSRNALIMMCKNCKADDDNSVSAFAYYPDSIGFDSKPLFTIDAARVRELSPQKTSKLQPSAAAIHPILQKIFILSSASNQLVITDLNGKVESVFILSKKLFPQPEGITFKTNGDMYISNEGVATRGTILKFVYNDTSEKEKTEVSKSGYSFSLPDEKLELRKQLTEISGMAYVPTIDVILTQNDEKGDIFVVDFKNKNDDAGKIKFSGKGDYEDIVYTDTAVYLLISTGSVVQVMTNDSSFRSREFTLDRGGNSEFESMYLGPDGKSLVLLCKDCSKEKDEIRTAYRFDLATLSFTTDPVYTIEITAIRKLLNDDMAEFKPSAAAIHPITGKLFIIASVGKLLVIADTNGKVEQVFRLDPALYSQPEGMTFGKNGDLYISNEGGEGIATILKFVYKN